MALGELFSGAGSFLGGLAGMFADNDDAQRTRAQMVEEWRRLNLPEQNAEFIPAPILREVAARTPELFTPENRDDQFEVYREDPEGRRSQLQNLAYLEKVRDEGMSDLDRLQAMDAQRGIARAHSRAQQSILRDLAARGRLGGGNEVLARQMAAQQAAELSRGLGSDLARSALERRMQGALAAGNQAQALRSQDFQVGQTRADTMNRWNQFMMEMLTGSAQQNALARERAQAANVAARQGRSDQNTLMDYENRVGHRDLRNQLAQQQFGNQVTKTQGITGGLAGIAAGQDAEAAARRDSLQSLGSSLGGLVGGGIDLWNARKPSAPSPSMQAPAGGNGAQMFDEMRKKNLFGGLSGL